MREARGMPPRKMPMAEVVRPRLSRRHERTFARGIDTLLAERGRVRVPISRRGIFGRGRALVRVETNLGPVIELHEQPSTLGRLFGRRGKVRRVWARP